MLAINIRLLNILLIFFAATWKILTLIRASQKWTNGDWKPVILDIYMVYFSLVQHDPPYILASRFSLPAKSLFWYKPFCAWNSKRHEEI